MKIQGKNLNSRCPGAGAVVLGMLLGSGISLSRTFTTQVVAEEGDFAPDGAAQYAQVLDNGPALNNSGRVVFGVRLNNAGSQRAVIARGFGPTVFLFRQGEEAPDFNGTFEEFSQFSLNGAGAAGLVGTLSGTAGVYDVKGVFVSDGRIRQIVRGDEPAPGGNGIISAFPVGTAAGALAINSAGEVTGRLQLVDTSGGSADDVVILRGDARSLKELARRGQSAPGGDSLLEFGAPSINDNGEVAFWARLFGNITFGYFLHDGMRLVRMARTGDAVPGGGLLSSFDTRETMVNSSGHIAFSATLSGTSLTKAIVLATGPELSVVARQGSPAPDGGTFLDFRPKSVITVTDPAVSLNDNDAVAFGARVTSSAGKIVDGLYLWDDGTLRRIAVRQQPAPGGNGFFDSFGPPIINAQGDVAFAANLTSASPGTGRGLFFYQASTGALSTIIRLGAPLSGSAIGAITFLNVPHEGNAANGFNDSGQAAFRYQLTDGRTGVALATPDDLASPVITVTGIGIGETGFEVTWSISNNAGVDIYRSDDLLDWGEPRSENNISGFFADELLPVRNRFYRLVPAGQDLP